MHDGRLCRSACTYTESRTTLMTHPLASSEHSSSTENIPSSYRLSFYLPQQTQLNSGHFTGRHCTANISCRTESTQSSEPATSLPLPHPSIHPSVHPFLKIASPIALNIFHPFHKSLEQRQQRQEKRASISSIGQGSLVSSSNAASEKPKTQDRTSEAIWQFEMGD